jgi:hypothetical protein
MAKPEDLKRALPSRGSFPTAWSAAIELTYKDPTGKPNVILLYRDREPTIEVVEVGRCTACGELRDGGDSAGSQTSKDETAT